MSILETIFFPFSHDLKREQRRMRIEAELAWERQMRERELAEQRRANDIAERALTGGGGGSRGCP